MPRCTMELCPNWAGDGLVCPCAVLDIEPAGPPVHSDCGQVARPSTPEDAGVEEDDELFPWCCDRCEVLFYV